jgi:hypothetical protein
MVISHPECTEYKSCTLELYMVEMKSIIWYVDFTTYTYKQNKTDKNPRTVRVQHGLKVT